MRFLLNALKRPPAMPPEAVHTDVPDLQGAALAAVYYGRRVGGDLYDFVRVGPSRVLFGLLDVAGRFENNHAIVSSAQSTFRKRAVELFADEEVNDADAMTELCLELNRTVLQAEGGGVRSCPAFVGCYHEDLGTICYFNAGHTPALLRDRNDIAELSATGLPLGLFSHATCDAPTVGLEPGASLLVVSRGIVEGKCGGDEYGLQRVKDGLQRTAAQGAKELCMSVLDGMQQFMCAPPTHNDVTALALVRSSASPLLSGTA